MDQVWRFNVDYTKVSDSSYFNDFDGKVRFQYRRLQHQRIQRRLRHYAKHDATVSTKTIPGVWHDQNTSSYSAEPQLGVNYYRQRSRAV